MKRIIHVVVGDDDWTPTADELKAVADLFQAADLDPLGARVVTRRGVSLNVFDVDTDTGPPRKPTQDMLYAVRGQSMAPTPEGTMQKLWPLMYDAWRKSQSGDET